MAKGWTTVETIYTLKNKPETLEEQRNKTKKFKRLMATTKTLTIPELKKQSIERYNEQKNKEDSLLDAYENKRLKSEKAIKQAIRIKKERMKKLDDAKQNTEKVSNNIEDETTESSV